LSQNEKIEYIRRRFDNEELFYKIGSRQIHYVMPENATQINTFYLPTFTEGAPLRVYFDPTYRCNLRCRHCITSSSPDAVNTNELSFQRIQQLFNELASIGVLEIVFTGGEPFILPRIFDIIKCAQDAGLNTIIASNGTLITMEKAKKLAELNVRDIRISIDGWKPINDDIRGVGAYKMAIEGLKNLLLTEVPVSVRMTHRKNIHNNLEYLFKDLNEVGITNLKAAVIKEAGNALLEENSDLLGYLPTEKAMHHLITLGKRYGIFVELSSDDFDFEPVIEGDKKLRKNRHNTCGAGFETAYISPEGNVLICSSIPHAILGNIKDCLFIDVWEGQIANNYRSQATACGEKKACRINFINILPQSKTTIEEKSDNPVQGTVK